MVPAARHMVFFDFVIAQQPRGRIYSFKIIRDGKYRGQPKKLCLLIFKMREIARIEQIVLMWARLENMP